MKKYYIIQCDSFTKGHIRIKASYTDVNNFVTMFHNVGLDASYYEDPDQSDH